MDNKQKKVLGLSLIVSAITMLFTLLVSPSKDKRGSRILAVLAFLEGITGLLVAVEEPRRLLHRRSGDVEIDEGELFDEAEATEADSAMYADPSRECECECAPTLNREIPCDDEATEADFM